MSRPMLNLSYSLIMGKNLRQRTDLDPLVPATTSASTYSNMHKRKRGSDFDHHHSNSMPLPVASLSTLALPQPFDDLHNRPSSPKRRQVADKVPLQKLLNLIDDIIERVEAQESKNKDLDELIMSGKFSSMDCSKIKDHDQVETTDDRHPMIDKSTESVPIGDLGTTGYRIRSYKIENQQLSPPDSEPMQQDESPIDDLKKADNRLPRQYEIVDLTEDSSTDDVGSEVDLLIQEKLLASIK